MINLFSSSILEQTSYTIIFLAGALGGFLHSAYTRRLMLPRVKRVDGETIIVLGFLGDIPLGVVAAFFVWATGLGNPDPPQSYAIALVSGFTATQIFSGFMNSRASRHVNNVLTEEITTSLQEDQEQGEQED